MSPLGIPPCGGDKDIGGAGRHLYCPVRCLTGFLAAAAMRRLYTAAYCGVIILLRSMTQKRYRAYTCGLS